MRHVINPIGMILCLDGMLQMQGWFDIPRCEILKMHVKEMGWLHTSNGRRCGCGCLGSGSPG